MMLMPAKSLARMPDRGQYGDQRTYHFFGDGKYAAVHPCLKIDLCHELVADI